MATTTGRSKTNGDALDLLEAEDLELRLLFTMLRVKRGNSVEERADYGDIAKDAIRHLATREAALVDVAHATAGEPELQALSQRLVESLHIHRPSIDRVEKMSRGVQGMNLRVGQDFAGEMEELIRVVGSEIEWELGEALPAIKGSLPQADRENELKSARHLFRHAPTNLSPKGPRWWERAPVISRLLTLYDRLRDFPRARARPRER
jgi:hypothetical protein